MHQCTDWAVSENTSSRQVSLSWPAFSDVEVVIGEEAFAFNAFLFSSDFILFGVGVVPGLGHKSLGFVLGLGIISLVLFCSERCYALS